MNETIQTQIAALAETRLPELQARYAEVIGEATRSPNKTFLIRRITEALAATADATATDDPASAPPEPAPAATLDTAGTPTGATTSDDHADAPDPDAAPDAPADAHAPAAPAAAPKTRLSKLSVDELRALYVEVVGRPTASVAKTYLVWKIREAQKGRVPVGPRSHTPTDAPASDFKVLPLRMDAKLVTQLDEARERLGLKSRTELFRRSLHAYLTQAGEAEVAALFAAEG